MKSSAAPQKTKAPLDCMSMNISLWHLIILLVILLLVFGPSRLEGLGSSLGKAIRGFKKGLEGAEDTGTQKTIENGSENKQAVEDKSKSNTPT